MNIHEQLPLHDCPYCGGAGLLQEEGGWCWSVMCLDCGAQTAHVEFKNYLLAVRTLKNHGVPLVLL